MADRTKAFALIGSPLGHSLSPFIHQKLMEQSAVNGTYTLKEIRSDTLEEHYLSELQMLDGFNVTIPHKTSIIT